MSPAEKDVWIGIAAVVAAIIALSWYFVLRYVSRASGWARLAKCYRAARRPAIRSKVRFSGDLNFGNMFNNSLSVGTDAGGLFISAPAFVAPMCPPLMIPWGEIQTDGVQPVALGGEFRFTTKCAPDVTWQLLSTPAAMADLFSSSKMSM